MEKPLQTTLEQMIEIRTSRREAIKKVLAAGGAMTAVWCLPGYSKASEFESTMVSAPATTEGFRSLPHVHESGDPASVKSIEVADGFQTQVLVRWGDPLSPDVKPIDFHNPSPADQEKQFGYNNDFIAYMPIEWKSGDARESANSRHGLLCVNNEYTNPELMFPGIRYTDKLETRTEQQIRVEAAAHGHSIVEIRQTDEGQWQVVQDSNYNRRITLNTEMRVAGPAAGHARLQTRQDPTGKKVLGTVSNCSGGVTPWGTVLSGEENLQFYFRNKLGESPEADNHQRYGINGKGDYSFYRIDDRFDLSQTPNEPNRFGWIIEIDPYHPDRPPIKRTAMGRMKHEGAATAVNHDNRVVVYTGDDERFEYLYKFVTAGKFVPGDDDQNRDLLDSGTLYVARFDADGTVKWLPLVHGEGPLTAENHFASQADVVIEARRAADLLGATPMDRPEDVEENPVTRNVFVVLTNNSSRGEDQVNAANPRTNNVHGHIIELEIPRVDGRPDHAATEHKWSIFLKAGRLESDDAWYNGKKPEAWLSCPDNIAFDNQGRLWIATDGFQKSSKILDGAYVCEVEGPRRALTKQFFHVPTGAELCGPCFTPDNTTLFVGVQHPGERSTFDEPSTRWPNPDDSDRPPQPSVVAITRKGGGPIGG